MQRAAAASCLIISLAITVLATACLYPAKAQSGSSLTTAQIDHMIRAEWQKNGLTPAPPADDAAFLRRVYLDIAGVVPPAAAVTDFISDKSKDKRAQAVAALLDSPGYADQWTNYWEHVLMGGNVRAQNVDKAAFKAWLHTQFERNVHWDKLVYSLISASGVNSSGGTLAMSMGATPSPSAAAAAGPTPTINGATNWILKYQGKPEDLSGNASRIFLGVQIQCAQCHDHKTEKWKQADFRSFTANFVATRPRPVDPKANEKGKVKVVDLEDTTRPFQPKGKKAGSIETYASAEPCGLDGTSFAQAASRRAALAAWMTAPENPWFAEAIVNRMWSHFMGRGFVEPIDDFRPSNPANMPELLHALADDFKASGFDLKHLITQITLTQAYQLSASGSAKPGTGNVYWAKYRLKPLSPDQMLDSLVSATGIKPAMEQNLGGNIDQIRYQLQRQFQFLFDVDEEFEQKDFEGTIPQALMLLNGGLVNTSVRPIPGTTLAELASIPTDQERIQSLYLRTLSRMPTATEVAKWEKFISEPREVATPQPAAPAAPERVKPGKAGKKAGANTGYNPLARAAGQLNRAPVTAKQQAYEDMFWALLNSSEFMFNH
jgi:Protein of unknown function (DUF1549)/Protein of unknown function (DUF1553)